MVTPTRDGGAWRIGTDAEVAWIAEGTSTGRTITAPSRRSLRPTPPSWWRREKNESSMIGPC